MGISITDPFIGYRTKIGKHMRLFTIARHSISQYTVLPIVKAIGDTQDKLQKINVENYRYEDGLFSLNYEKGDHFFKVLGLVYYDKVNITAKRNTKESTFNFIKNDFPLFFGEVFNGKK